MRNNRPNQKRMPIILDNFDESIALDSDNDPMKFSYPNYPREPDRFTEDLKLKGVNNSLSHIDKMAAIMSPEIGIEGFR